MKIKYYPIIFRKARKLERRVRPKWMQHNIETLPKQIRL